MNVSRSRVTAVATAALAATVLLGAAVVVSKNTAASPRHGRPPRRPAHRDVTITSDKCVADRAVYDAGRR